MEILDLATTRAYMYVIDPVNLAESVPPNVNSPFWIGGEVVGSNDTETRSDEIVPWLNRLSVTVGMGLFVSGDSVPTVKSTGPILGNKPSTRFKPTDGLGAYPRIPSNSSKPLEFEATPMDCFLITSSEEIVTVSKYSVPKTWGVRISKRALVIRKVPENDPDPYVTDWGVEISRRRTTISKTRYLPHCHRSSHWY